MSSYVYFKTYQKIISVLLIICFLTIPLTFLTFPKKAEAVCTPFTIPPVPDLLSVPTHPSVTSTINLGDIWQKSNTWFKTCILDGLATTIAKTIIKQLTGSIVRWINSGFKGNPSFVQNPGKFFGGIADKVAGNVIENIAPFLCSPFRLNIQLALALSQTGDNTDLSCSLTDVENNFKNFTNGSGGWDNWFQITQNPQNNPYGAAMIAGAQLNIAVETAQGTYQQQLDWGKGFLSFESCPSSQNQNAAGANYTPGNGYHTGANGKQVYDANNQPVYGVQAGDNNCLIETPGAVIESQLENTLGSDLRGLEIAQSIDQIVAALVGQLVTQALGGIGGLAGAGSSNSSGGGSSVFNYQNSINGGLGGAGNNGGSAAIPDLPLTGACTPSNQNAQIGDTVTWNAYVPDINGDVTYTWYGEGLTSNSSSATTEYTTNGVKTASVIVSTTGTNPQSAQFDCAPDVSVGNTTSTSTTNLAPIISCSASANTVAIGIPVTWQAVVVGGSAPFIYNWQGDDSLIGSNQSTVKTYSTAGIKTAAVEVTSADGNTYSQTCGTTVTVTP